MASTSITLDDLLKRVEKLEKFGIKSAYHQETVWSGTASSGTLTLSKNFTNCDLINIVFSYYSNQQIQSSFITPSILKEYGRWTFASYGGENSDRNYNGYLHVDSDSTLRISGSGRLTIFKIILVTFGGGVVKLLTNLSKKVVL